MAVLITGGTGFIGSQLARLALDQGELPVLLDPSPPGPQLAGVEDKIKYVPSTLNSLSSLVETIRAENIDSIFHLGGLLSMPSEKDPWCAYEVNIKGTRRMLEAARLGGVRQFVFASSIAVYGEDIPPGQVDEASVEHPTSIYGLGKVFGEHLGKYYARRFGLDFRAIRLASVVGPGSKVPHMSIYNCWAIEKPLMGEPYRILVSPGTRCAVIYYKDAAQAFWQLSQAPVENIRTKVYNLIGVDPPYSAEELVEAVRKAVPGADLGFTVDPEVDGLLANIGRMAISDARARKEWGWRPLNDLPGLIEQFRADFLEMRSWKN